jgi:hypothetical protein
MIVTVGPVASIWQVTGQQDTAPWHAEGSCILSHSSISNLQSWCAVQTGCKGAVLASAVAYLVLLQVPWVWDRQQQHRHRCAGQ